MIGLLVDDRRILTSEEDQKLRCLRSKVAGAWDGDLKVIENFWRFDVDWFRW